MFDLQFIHFIWLLSISIINLLERSSSNLPETKKWILFSFNIDLVTNMYTSEMDQVSLLLSKMKFYLKGNWEYYHDLFNSYLSMFVYMGVELHWYVIIMMHLDLLVSIRSWTATIENWMIRRSRDETIFILKAHFIYKHKSTLVQILYHIKNIHFFNWVSNISNRNRRLSHLITGLCFLSMILIYNWSFYYSFDHSYLSKKSVN
jgi:hypothetical protein